MLGSLAKVAPTFGDTLSGKSEVLHHRHSKVLHHCPCEGRQCVVIYELSRQREKWCRLGDSNT